MQESIKRANGSRRVVGGGGVTAGVRACDHTTSVGGCATGRAKGGRGGYRPIHGHMGARERARLYAYIYNNIIILLL